MENVQPASFPRLNEAAPDFNVKTTHDRSRRRQAPDRRL